MPDDIFTVEMLETLEVRIRILVVVLVLMSIVLVVIFLKYLKNKQLVTVHKAESLLALASGNAR